MLGTSGTVTTIAGVYLDLPRYDRRRVDGCWMSDDAGDRRGRAAARHELRRARRQSLHRRRARRSGAGRLRHPRSDPPRVPVRAAARRRPRPARGHAGADDARGRRLGRRRRRPRRDNERRRGRGERELKVRVKDKRKSQSSQAVARAPAQRSLRGARQARRLSLARRLQADRDRRQAPHPQSPARGWSISAPRPAAGARSRPSASARAAASSASTCSKWTRSPASSFAQIDFLDPAAPDKLKAMLGGPADVVLSDMAANATGHRQTDHLKIMALVEAAAEFAARGAEARRRVSRQGDPGRHRRRRCSPRSSATSPP